MEIEKKIWPEFFEQVVSSQKTYELRLADFRCQPGDKLILKEWDPAKQEYTGRQVTKRIGYVGMVKAMEQFHSPAELAQYGLQVISLQDE